MSSEKMGAVKGDEAMPGMEWNRLETLEEVSE